MSGTFKRSGFTLVEIMVVIGIIGLLSALAVVTLAKQQSNSRNARRMEDLKSMQTALELYTNDNNAYPIVSTAVEAWSGDPTSFRANRPGGASGPMGAYIPNLTPNYLQSLPIDPLYNPATEPARGYVYLSPTNGANYAFVALGTPEGTWTSDHPFYDAVRPKTHAYPSWKISTPAYNNR